MYVFKEYRHWIASTCCVQSLKGSAAVEDDNCFGGESILSKLLAAVGERWKCGLLKFVT